MSTDLPISSNPQAERAVLGACLADGRAFFRVSDLLSPEDFYVVGNGLIWDAMGSVAKSGAEIDLMTVTGQLEGAGKLSLAGGVSGVASLNEGLPDPGNIEHYAAFVVDCSVKRRLSLLGMRIARDAASDTGNPNDIIGSAEDELVALTTRRDSGRLKSSLVAVSETASELERVANDGRPDMATGYHDLDKIMYALEPQDLILLAARPSVGKTAFAANVIANVCARGKRVLFCSLEMSTGSIMKRLIAREGKIDHSKLRFPEKGDTEFWQAVSFAQDTIGDWKLWVDDTGGITVADVLSKARRMRMQEGLDLIVVDYLQIMGDSHDREGEVAKITAISGGLKNIAKTLKVPILVLSQLNRNLGHREDKRPTLFDLRGSGSLEQDADVVLTLHPLTSAVGSVEVEVGVVKHRNGPVGRCSLLYFPETLRFESKYMGVMQ